MRVKRLIPTVASAAAVVFFAGVVVLAAITTVVVYPGNLQGWQTQVVAGAQPTPASTPSVDFVFGPTPPPLGRGSAQLAVGSDGSAAAQLRHPDYAGTALPTPTPTPDPDVAPPPTPPNELTALSYSTYVQVGGSAGQAPFIILNVDYDNNGTQDDQLVFEPQYQIAGFCPSNPQGPVAAGVWQTWDAFNGCWYSTGGAAGSGPGANVKLLRTITAAQPNAKIVNAADGGGGVRIAAGFGGVIGGGSAADWAGFVGNVDAFKIAVGADPDTGPNGTLYDFEPKAPPTPATRGVIISEFRNSGPSDAASASPAPAGHASPAVSVVEGAGGDEYVELYNTTDNEIAVTSDDGSGGWSLVKRGATCADPPVVVATIPDGTVIPARGHYLIAGGGYSLGQYPAGDGSAQTPRTSAGRDQSLTDTIAGDVDIGLFSTKDPSFFDYPRRLDAVGFNNGSGDTCDLLTEGTPLPNTRGSTSQYAFVRRQPLSGGVQDTNNNAADFVEVSTTPQTSVGDNASPVLGAPGPKNTSSPVSHDDTITFGLTSPTAGQAAPPNRERDPTPGGQCAPLGTLRIRRSVTNNTGTFVSRLRFRVIQVTTVHSDNVTNAGEQQAVLRVLTSSDETLTAVPGRGDVQVHGLTDEQAAIEVEDADQCGGWNTSLSDDTVTLESPLAPGATIDVVFLLGVEQTGHFRFYVNVEALESSAPATPSAPAPAASTKRPTALTNVTPPSKPTSAGTTPAAPSGAAPAPTAAKTRPASTPTAPPATQGVTPPARPSVTPGVWRKLPPDEQPDAMPVLKRTRRDSE